MHDNKPKCSLSAGKYELEGGCIKGDRAIVVAGKERDGGRRAVMCKFVQAAVDYERDLQLHDLLPEDSVVPGLVFVSFPESSASSGLASAIAPMPKSNQGFLGFIKLHHNWRHGGAPSYSHLAKIMAHRDGG